MEYSRTNKMKINCSICNIQLNVSFTNSLSVMCLDCFRKSHDVDVDVVNDEVEALDPRIWTEWTQEEINFARKIDENKFDR
jgi:hypothetical protein